MGMPAPQAVMQAIGANIETMPEYIKYKQEKAEAAALEKAKAEADIGLVKAKTAESVRASRAPYSGGGRGSAPKVDYKSLTSQIMSAAGYNPTNISFTQGQATNIDEIKEIVEAKTKTEGMEAALIYAQNAMNSG